MKEVNDSPSIGFSRRLTDGERNPFDLVEWGTRNVAITNWQDGSIAFEQKNVEFPVNWSVNASNIVSQKYFWGAEDSEERETSLKDLLNRVVNQIVNWGEREGYFASIDEKSVFAEELTALLILQKTLQIKNQDKYQFRYQPLKKDILKKDLLQKKRQLLLLII